MNRRPRHSLLRSFAQRPLALLLIVAVPQFAQQPALPMVVAPFAGDPRLEPIPGAPLALNNYGAFANGFPIQMRFPPRVNGQAQSDGDGSADLLVFFYAETGERVVQRVVLEAAPKGAAPGVLDLAARLFSPVWQIHAVTVTAGYDPGNPAHLIDSFSEAGASPFVTAVYPTNIYLNAAVVPPGSTVPASAPATIEGYYEGSVALLAPSDVSDGPFPPQTLFKFENPNGDVLPSASNPHLVASRTQVSPFHSPIWEVWTVRVPLGLDVTQLRSRSHFLNANGVPIAPFSVGSSGIRLNAPIAAFNGVPMPVEDAFAFLTDASGRFNPAKFPFEVPASTFQPRRNFVLSASESNLLARTATASDFPRIDPFGKGNVIPLILADPFQTQSSGPNTTGPFLRIDQVALDAAAQSVPPRLPPAIENNFATLIASGLLTPDWAPGGRPYQDRLALAGRALHELVYRPEDGANSKDVTSCGSCHSRPRFGGGAEARFNLPPLGGGPPLNPSSIWGSGPAELLNILLRLGGAAGLTSPHGSLGNVPTLRGFAKGAPDRHMGVQSAEFVAGQLGNPNGFDAVTDLDGDGVSNEMSVGEVTAQTAWMLTLPVPDVASPAVRQNLGISDISLSEGRMRFRRSIDDGGAGCASCHTVFHRMQATVYPLRNPQTSSVRFLNLPNHQADADDVAEGSASFVGEAGLRMYGDFRSHKMGSRIASAGTDTMKTAELWDAGSTFPYLRVGEASSLLAAIQAHSGVSLNVQVFRGQQVNQQVQGVDVSTQFILVRNPGTQAIPASAAQPIRVVLAGAVTPGATVRNASAPAPGGSLRQGAVWHITQPIPPQGTAVLPLSFENPGFAPLVYDLLVQDHSGYSEAAASIQAFEGLSSALQNSIVDFLRAQVVGNAVER